MNENLPIWERKDEITHAVQENDIVILTAETGSGKSTQVPQYLYYEGYNVIVTQPRRIACTSLADRVLTEMNMTQDIVSYQTAFESTRTPSTKVLFCTDGLQVAKGIRNFENTVLIIDEVHEWNLNIETLVAWIKRFREEGNHIKVVLMSATIDTEDLEKFYQSGSSVECISIQGRTYDVCKFHKSTNTFIQTIVDYANENRNILVFVPGKKEISDTISDLIEEHLDATILPLHGELSYDEQRDCFKSFRNSKIIISTNIAQTSITIPDIDVVIDLGTAKEVIVENGIEGLFIHNISKADCLQRAGRAGRTKDGIYVLCSSYSLDDRDEYPTPEIQRLSLEKLVLKLMSVDIDPEFLDFYHQPSKVAILEAKRVLKILGGISNNKITELGKKMVQMPISVKFARMVIEAEKLDCVSEILKAVSIMEIGSLISPRPVKRPSRLFGTDERQLTYSDFTKENKSDVIAEINIYDDICDYKFKNLVEAGINKKTFFRIKELHKKLCESLSQFITIGDDRRFDLKNKSNVIRCIGIGMIDNLYQSDSYFDNTCHDKRNHSFKIARGSVVDMVPFLFGIPRTISYKNRWGDMATMDIVTLNTGITVDQLIEIVGIENITTSIFKDTVRYDVDADEFSIQVKTEYDTFIINNEIVTVGKEDQNYNTCHQMFREIVEKEKRIDVPIGENIYRIEYRDSGLLYRDDTIPHVYINNVSDIMNSTLTYWKAPNDKFVIFHYRYMAEHDLQKLKEDIIEEKRRREEERNRPTIETESITTESQRTSVISERQTSSYLRRPMTEETLKNKRKKEMKAKIPTGESSELSVIIDDFIPKIGEIIFDYPEFNMEGPRYVGLSCSGRKVSLALFDEEAERDQKTLDTLKTFVTRTVSDKYSDTNFIIRRAGRKFETEESKMAKEEFHTIVNDILSDLSVDNFEENMELLDELYHDCISSVPLLIS